MVDCFNLLIGIALMLLGIVFLIPAIRYILDNKIDEYGTSYKGIVGGFSLFVVGLIMALRAIF